MANFGEFLMGNSRDNSWPAQKYFCSNFLHFYANFMYNFTGLDANSEAKRTQTFN